MSDQQTENWTPSPLHLEQNKSQSGCFGLIRELSRISHHLDPSVPMEWMVKRMQFFAYELESHVESASTARDRLAALNLFFFDAKKFQCVLEPQSHRDPLHAYAFNRVLIDRAGSATVLTAMYAFLAERIGTRLEFIDLKPSCFLKWNDQSRSRYIDITRGGATLSSDELIEVLSTRFQINTFCQQSALETYSSDQYLTDYILDLKSAIFSAKSFADKVGPEAIHAKNEAGLFLLNTLMSYQPHNLQLFGERSLFYHRLGNHKAALADLKRYFAFHEREKAPIELVKLHDELLDLMN